MPVQAQFSIDEPDNARLASLCGALDANLRTIESALDVRITRRGSTFTIEGDETAPARTARLLDRLYHARRHPLSNEELQLAIIESRHSSPADLPVTEALPPQSPDNPTFRTRRGEVQGRTPNQRKYLKNILAHDLSFGIGPAGTGKTYLAMAKAVDALARKQVSRIILTRPAVEAGENLGFLPGSLTDKIDPYLRPLYDALHDMLEPEALPRLMAAGTIEVAPLAYMRGRTLNDAFVILDEAQNTSPEQMKMFLTRLGFGSKMVVTGDVSQIDLPGQRPSGLLVVRRILDGVDGIAFCELGSADVVRHRLVGRIVEAYSRYEAQTAAERAAPAPGHDHDRARDNRDNHKNHNNHDNHDNRRNRRGRTPSEFRERNRP